MRMTKTTSVDTRLLSIFASKVGLYEPSSVLLPLMSLFDSCDHTGRENFLPERSGLLDGLCRLSSDLSHVYFIVKYLHFGSVLSPCSRLYVT